MSDQYNIEPIGHVVCERSDLVDDDWDNVAATIKLDESSFSAESLSGLDAYSHVEVIYLFHKVAFEKIQTASRHPRNRVDWPKVGIFAQRVKNRPNRLGLTTCRLLSISGTKLSVAGLDAINGTPVLDIKPVMHGFEPRGVLREPNWAAEIMSDYWLKK